MAVSFQSSIAQNEALRFIIKRAQRDFAEATTEVSTGTYADEGLALGANEKELTQLRIRLEDVNAFQKSNDVIATRLTTIQSTLQSMRDMADDIVGSLVSALQGSDRQLIVEEAKARLMTLNDLTATSINGVYLFGGTNLSSRPVPETGMIATAKSVIASSFVNHFGIPMNDPAAKSISAEDIDAYIAGALASEFDNTAWRFSFSSATDEPTFARIQENVAVPVSVTANERGIRDLYKSLLSLTELAGANLNDAAHSRLLATLTGAGASASQDLARVQGQLGIHQQRLRDADVRLSWQHNLLDKEINAAVSVDISAAALRVNGIASQLQASYSLTVRLQKMSLLNYM